MDADRKMAANVSRQVARKDSAARPNAYAKGVFAEDVAETLLNQRGFKVLARRYKTPAGEVDLIAASPSAVAFVEVKRRSGRVRAGEAITLHQQERVAGAAECWLQANPEYADRDMTFDAILVCPRRAPFHIRDAFRPHG